MFPSLIGLRKTRVLHAFFIFQKNVSIPHRIEKNPLAQGPPCSACSVSIPHRIEKNENRRSVDYAGKYVSIPHRIEKNPDGGFSSDDYPARFPSLIGLRKTYSDGEVTQDENQFPSLIGLRKTKQEDREVVERMAVSIPHRIEKNQKEAEKSLFARIGFHPS